MTHTKRKEVMNLERELVVKAEDLPLAVKVIGKGHKVSSYLMIPTRNRNGAQLCADEASRK